MAFLLVCLCVCVFLFIINEENSVIREDNFLERAKIFFPAYFFHADGRKKHRKKNKRETQRPPSKQHQSVAQRDTHEEFSTKDKERRKQKKKGGEQQLHFLWLLRPRFVRERKKERDKIARGGWEERER